PPPTERRHPKGPPHPLRRKVGLQGPPLPTPPPPAGGEGGGRGVTVIARPAQRAVAISHSGRLILLSLGHRINEGFDHAGSEREVFGMSDNTDAVLDLRHANEFTDIENTAVVYVLRGWFASLAAIPGAIEAGDDAWAFTT